MEIRRYNILDFHGKSFLIAIVGLSITVCISCFLLARARADVCMCLCVRCVCDAHGCIPLITLVDVCQCCRLLMFVCLPPFKTLSLF